MGCLRHLIGKTRQPLMQRLHRILHSIRCVLALDAEQPVFQSHHMGLELFECLCLFACGNIDLRCSFGHGAIVLGLTAFGVVEPAGDASKLVFD